MIGEQVFYDKSTIKEIKETAVLDDVIADFVDLKPQGSSLIGVCPHCQAKKFTVTKSKGVYKCFSGCGKSGKDALKFLQDVLSKEFIDSLNYLADRYNIQPKTVQVKRKATNRKNKFRDEQLKASGITNKYQQYNMRKDTTTEVVADRYQTATIDPRTWQVKAGDDMVLHYLDLDGQPLMYTPTASNKSLPLIRIRWANPELHRGREGSPMKYQSPPKSGSHIWIPNAMIKAYKQKTIIETLVITEGEKKADRLCLSGIYAVGIMGIHNWSSATDMPYQFERIIKECSVSRVVFLLDSDWQDISIKHNQAVEQRPKTFFKAVYKFREYFYGYINAGRNLRLYFGHVKSEAFKGIDDLIVREIGTQKEDQEKLSADFAKALSAKEGEGDYVNIFDITEATSYQIKSHWRLESPPRFLNHHKDKLKELPIFIMNGMKRQYNEETDEFELAQKVLPHEQYWLEQWTESNGGYMKYTFYYQGCLSFLSNRGYGLYEYKTRSFRFIHMDNKVVEETDPLMIRHFMLDFTKEIGKKNVLELLLKGGKQYFGQDNLSNLARRDLRFNRADKNCMYFYFKNCFWKITPDNIEQRSLSELPYYVWKDQLIDFEPRLLDNPLVKINKKGDKWTMEPSDEFEKSDMASFYLSTSDFFWQKRQTVQQDVQGNTLITNKEHPEALTEDELQATIKNMVAKMLAAGYMMHDYLDYGNMKAVVCMDGVEGEVGKSQGGTGKSIWAKQFEHLVPMEIIDGKKKNIEEDNHIYEEVDDRTKVILFDDVRVNFNFEFLFSHITTGVTVNPKGEKRHKLPPPKFAITTNHALNGDDNSHDRRQYNITFSDFFNKARTVRDHYGHQFFHEWEFEQWNYFYNWLATCVQHYLKFRLMAVTDDQMLVRRKLRQTIGENFLNWASLVFDTSEDDNGDWAGILLNKRIEKGVLLDNYLKMYPRDSRYVDATKLKEKLRKYAEYAELDYNLPSGGGRIKSSGKEYFIISNDKYVAQMYHPAINADEDNAKWRDRNEEYLPSYRIFRDK